MCIQDIKFLSLRGFVGRLDLALRTWACVYSGVEGNACLLLLLLLTPPPPWVKIFIPVFKLCGRLDVDLHLTASIFSPLQFEELEKIGYSGFTFGFFDTDVQEVHTTDCAFCVSPKIADLISLFDCCRYVYPIGGSQPLYHIIFRAYFSM